MRRSLRPECSKINSARHSATTILWDDSSCRSAATRVPSADTDFESPQEYPGDAPCFLRRVLLPAAMLGLDCMKLLEGAVAVNDHFRDASPDENIVMRLAAIIILRPVKATTSLFQRLVRRARTARAVVRRTDSRGGDDKDRCRYGGQPTRERPLVIDLPPQR